MQNKVHTYVELATGWREGAYTVVERPSLPHQSNLLYDVRRGDEHLILKLYQKPGEQEIAP